jgi:uncharacterized membrane protein
MLPNPLHPALVHFPIVFVVLLPIAALVALWTIRRGAAPTRAWLVPTALAVGLALSAWIAVETGEQQEEVVERVVAEQTIETHGELAERFLLLSAAMAGLAGIGLFKNRVGSAARALGLFAAIGLMFVGYQVGHTGGELVYRHGAAAAYVDAAAGSVARTDTRSGSKDDDGDDREDR